MPPKPSPSHQTASDHAIDAASASLSGRAPGDAEAQGQLDGGEEGVQHDHVVVDEVRRPGDRAGHHAGIAVRALGQHVREALGEHGRLELQDAVQHPDDAEAELELAARIERGDAGGVSGPAGGPGLSAADREALAHVAPPLRN